MNSLFEQGENVAARDQRHPKMSGWLKHHSEHITRGHNTRFVVGLIGMVSLEFRSNKTLFCYLAVNEPPGYRAKAALHHSNVKYGSRSLPAMDYLDRWLPQGRSPDSNSSEYSDYNRIWAAWTRPLCTNQQPLAGRNTL